MVSTPNPAAAVIRRIAERALRIGGPGRSPLETEVRQLRVVVRELLDRHHHALDLPPEELRLHVGTTTTVANFLSQGANSSKYVLAVFGTDPQGPVLDWGCGTGRTLRWLWEFPSWRSHYRGCDIDGQAIGWLRSQGVQNVVVSNPDPPLPYPERSLSGVFAFSVLTHIHPSRHRDWYAEIKRVLEPGGRAYLTTHGARVAGRLPQPYRRAFEADGCTFMESEGHSKDAAVVSEAFTRSALDGILELMEFTESGYQDMDAFLVQSSTDAGN